MKPPPTNLRRAFTPVAFAALLTSAASPALLAAPHRVEITPGKGTSYYVSPEGNDSAAGAEKSPFKTLQRAADTVHAGDTVNILPGTYTTGMNLIGRPAGTAENPIAFIARDGVTLTHCAAKGANASLAAINIESTSGWVIIQGFHIKSDGSMQRAGIRVAGSDHTQILDNTVDSAFIGIFVSNCAAARVENNTCENATDQHGIYISRDCSGYIVRRNSLHGNNWDGLHTNAVNGHPNSAGLIENNTIYDNHLSGIDVEGTTDSTFRNNLIFNNAKNGIVLHSQDQADTPACTGNAFINNTIVGNGMFAIEIAPGGNTANTLFNNILFSKTRTYGSIGIADPPRGLVSDFNALNDDVSTDLGKSAIPIALWRSRTGQDQHSIIGAPAAFFVDASQSDFRPRAKSPGLSAGAPSLAGHDAPAMDFTGKPRTKDQHPDLGALEPAEDSPATAP